MRIFSTILRFAKIPAFILFFAAPFVAVGQVLFSQNFNASTDVANYHSPTPSTNQFDFMGVSAPGPTFRCDLHPFTNQLRITRPSNIFAFARTTGFTLNAMPTVLRVRFKFLVDNSTVAPSTPIVLYVGSGLAADASIDDAALTHSRLEVVFTTTSGTFQLRNAASGLSSSNLTGRHEVNWYINNSGATINYITPFSGTATLDNDKADVWSSFSRVLTAVPATTGTQDLTDFKFLYYDGGGTIVLDDIEISGANDIVLPVLFTSFTANQKDASNQLIWTTEGEQNASYYTVERSNDGRTFAKIGQVTAQGKATTYTFEDKTPLSISYYRLQQVDFDGKGTLSEVVSVSQDTKGRISVAPNPAEDKINVYLSQNDVNVPTTVTLFDLTGKQVLIQNTTTDICPLDLSNLPKGIYILKVQSNGAIYQEKVIRQ